MPVNILLTFIIGSALGWIVIQTTRAPSNLRGLILGCCAAGKSLYKTFSMCKFVKFTMKVDPMLNSPEHDLELEGLNNIVLLLPVLLVYYYRFVRFQIINYLMMEFIQKKNDDGDVVPTI